MQGCLIGFVFSSYPTFSSIAWGGYVNVEQLSSLEMLHRRAVKVIYNLPCDIQSAVVYRHSKWSILSYLYKLRLIKLFYKVFSGEAPAALSDLVSKPCVAYDFRRSNKITVPRFNSHVLKTSLSVILWNAVSTYFTGSQFYGFLP